MISELEERERESGGGCGGGCGGGEGEERETAVEGGE